MKHHKRKLRYGVAYYVFAQGKADPFKYPATAHGASSSLEGLTRNAAGRLAIDNYRRAFIVDYHKGQVVKVLNRTGQGITITEKEY